MTNTTRCSCALVLLVSSLWLYACGGGSAEIGIPAPAITGLNTAEAMAGQTIIVTGLNFGMSQATSVLRLNGLDFLIRSWTDTRIEATVPAGATSGTLIVTVDGRQSTGGNAAYLTISSAVRPALQSVTPDHGLSGSAVALAGMDFGEEALTVVFTSSAGTDYPAGVTAWSDTSAMVTVPFMPPGACTIAITLETWRSTELAFTCEQETTETGPVITDVSPGSGAAGTTVEINGTRFGTDNTAGVLRLGELDMVIAEWTNTRIIARVPLGAVSAKITVTVDGQTAVWPEADGEFFIVNEQPEVTSFSPEEIVMGQSLQIYGYYFQDTPGTVLVGGTEQPCSAWEPVNDEGLYRITVPTVLAFTDLPDMKYDGLVPIRDENRIPVDYYELQVVTQNNLASRAVDFAKGTALAATVSVDQTVGRRMDDSGANGTVFTFSAVVTGGSGEYILEIYPNRLAYGGRYPDPSPETPNSLEYVYPFAWESVHEEDFDTVLRITDRVTGDSTTAAGPSVHIVTNQQPVITALGLYDFNRDGQPAPNDLCYNQATADYGCISVGDVLYFTSNRCTVTEGGVPLVKYTRNLAAYMIDGEQPRPLGYRYRNVNTETTDDGSIIVIRGHSFGDEVGQVILNADEAEAFTVTELAPGQDLPTGWSDTEIRLYMPPELVNLSGTVRVIPADQIGVVEFQRYADSQDELICSPCVTLVNPVQDFHLADNPLLIVGYDVRPSYSASGTGGGNYSIWYVPVRYSDPWTGGDVTGHGLLITPVRALDAGIQDTRYDLAGIDPDRDGFVTVEVNNADGSASALVSGELVDGDYSFFLWTGVLEEGTPEEIANSGIFSELYHLYDVMCNSVPEAGITATPDTGIAPFTVAIDGRSSVDADGTIVNYEWDLDGNGIFNEEGEEAAAEGFPGPHYHTYDQVGYRNIGLKVTDDDGEVDWAFCRVTVEPAPVD